MTTATLAPKKYEELSSEYLHELRVKAGDNLKVFLGSFDVEEPVRGFVIEVTPSTVPQEIVHTKITRLDGEINTKFFLDITNKAQRSIRARIRAI